MADDPQVFNGTRYDALRIIGVDTWDRRGAQLSRYLKKGKGIDDELVQGAIGGLGTMRSPHVGAGDSVGISALQRRKPRLCTRCPAERPTTDVGPLGRRRSRAGSSRADLGAARIEKLTHSTDAAVRARARKLLATTGKLESPENAKSIRWSMLRPNCPNSAV